MPTIGELYSPLIELAKVNDPKGHELLKEVGKMIFENNKEKCNSIEEGIEAAKANLDYYCQYYSPDTAIKVKKFYQLGSEFRSLFGKTDIPMV